MSIESCANSKSLYPYSSFGMPIYNMLKRKLVDKDFLVLNEDLTGPLSDGISAQKAIFYSRLDASKASA